MEGWIKLHREIMEHPDYFSEPFPRMMAWIDLLMMANHRPANLRIRGNRIALERGQAALAQQTLAERWKWSRGKVKRYLAELETAGAIRLGTSHVIHTITIVRYDEEQGAGTSDQAADPTAERTTDLTAERPPERPADGTANGSADAPQTDPQTDPNKKENTKKKESMKKDSFSLCPEKNEETYPLAELAEKLGGQLLWLEQVAMQRGLPSAAEARGWLERFLGELRIRGRSRVTEGEARSHFVNWLKIQLDKSKRTPTKPPSHANTRNQTPKRVTGSDFD